MADFFCDVCQKQLKSVADILTHECEGEEEEDQIGILKLAPTSIKKEKTLSLEKENKNIINIATMRSKESGEKRKNVKPLPMNKRMGVFYLSRKELFDTPELCLGILSQCVVIGVKEIEFLYNAASYRAFCPQFEEWDETKALPFYTWKRNERGEWIANMATMGAEISWIK